MLASARISSIFFLVWCCFFFPNPVFTQPHPFFWKLVQGISLLYLLLIVFLFFQDLDDVRQWVTYFDSSLGKPLILRPYADDCRIYTPEKDFPFANIRDNILDEYITVGVDTKYLQISNRYPTTSSYIIANTSIGSRTILTYKDMGIHMAPVSLLDNEFDYILFDGYEKEFAMEAIRRNPNAVTLLDAGSVKEATVELAKVVDYVICSHDFAIEYSKVDINYEDIETIKKAYEVLAKDFKHVIITLESYGCFTKIEGEYILVPSIEVKAVDSTGAGDIYHGAFMYGLIQGFDIEKTMRFANITGALSCLRVGSRLSIPDLKEVEEAYDANSQK